MVLGSTQLLVKISTRNILGGKGGQCMRLTTSSPSLAECHEIWEPKSPGTLWATPGLLRDCFTFTYKLYINFLKPTFSVVYHMQLHSCVQISLCLHFVYIVISRPTSVLLSEKGSPFLFIIFVMFVITSFEVFYDSKK
jgi:hypothetical protein